MKSRMIHFVLITFSIQIGCSGPPPSDPKLKEAYAIHQQYLNIGDESMKTLKKFPENDISRVKFQSQIMEWGENIIEIPGFPCNHNHEFFKHRHNGDQLKLSPDDMLVVQKELLDSVLAIQSRIKIIDTLRSM